MRAGLSLCASALLLVGLRRVIAQQPVAPAKPAEGPAEPPTVLYAPRADYDPRVGAVEDKIEQSRPTRWALPTTNGTVAVRSVTRLPIHYGVVSPEDSWHRQCTERRVQVHNPAALKHLGLPATPKKPAASTNAARYSNKSEVEPRASPRPAATNRALCCRFFADAVVIAHLGFILFALLGGLLVSKRPRLVWLHIPAVLWAAGIEWLGFPCPLTFLEDYLRAGAGGGADPSGFVERYIARIVYPPGLTPGAQGVLGAAVLGLNLALYAGWAARRQAALRKRRAQFGPLFGL